MSSLKRILASRANGARSKGPKTPEGKRRSSANAVRHGLLANCVIVGGESRPQFDSLVACHLEHFDPVDGVEFGMIEEMASAYWRMRRLWAIEQRLFENSLARQDEKDDELGRLTAAFSSLAATPDLALLHRYETRLHRIYQRGLHNLLLLRANSATESGDIPSPIDEPDPQQRSGRVSPRFCCPPDTPSQEPGSSASPGFCCPPDTPSQEPGSSASVVSTPVPSARNTPCQTNLDSVTSAHASTIRRRRLRKRKSPHTWRRKPSTP